MRFLLAVIFTFSIFGASVEAEQLSLNDNFPVQEISGLADQVPPFQ